MSVSLQDLVADTAPPTDVESTYSKDLVTPKSVSDHSCNRGFWITFVVAVIVLVVLMAIANSGKEWYANLNNEWTWTKESNWVILGLILIVVILLLAYVSWIAYVKADSKTRWWIGATFMVTLILLIVLFAVFYIGQNIKAAFWVGLFLILVGLVHTAAVWRVDYRAGMGVLPYLIWAVVAVTHLWHLGCENEEDC